MKKQAIAPFPEGKRTIKIVQIVMLLLVAGLTHIQASTYAQTATITVSARNETLGQVLKQIEHQSEFLFFYNSNEINENVKITLNKKDCSLSEVLDAFVSKLGLTYTIKDRHVVLSVDNTPRQPAATAKAVTPGVSQSRKITGTITDATGEPIIGANVVVKGANVGTVTDINGNFTLNVPAQGTLLVSYIGYNTQEVPIRDKSDVKIVLVEDTQKLEEVVVVGYGTQKKVTVTGAVAAIGADEIVQAPVSNISNALVGRLPGVRVQNTGGMPGSESSVDIRGFGKPLVLVDGIEQPGFQLDPNEIESISVLKDAAAAIYGVKAGNGVVLITTKKGTVGKAKITYNGSVGFQSFTSYPNVVNAAQYAELVDEDAMNHGNAPIYGPEKLELFRQGTQDGYKSYNWKDILTRKNAPQTQHNININGGNESVKYFASVGYLDQQGIYTTGDLSFSRYNFRSNVSAKLAKYLTADIQLGGHVENHMSPYDEDTYIVHAITRMIPTFSPYANDNDTEHYGLTNFQNPLARADADVSGYRKSKKKLFNGSFSLKYDMPFVPGLSAKVLFSYVTKVEEFKDFGKEFYLYSYDQANDSYNKIFTGNSPSSLNRRDYTSEQNLLQFSLNSPVLQK